MLEDIDKNTKKKICFEHSWTKLHIHVSALSLNGLIAILNAHN